MTAFIAHLSDIHLSIELEERRQRFRSALKLISMLPRVDAIVVTGDLADHGLDEEYSQLHHELNAHVPGIPSLFTTGNHDDPGAYLRAFGSRHSVLDVAGFRIVGLDSSPLMRPVNLGEDAGLLDDDALRFARTALESTDLPALIALHHPPCEIGHTPIDSTLLARPDTLATLISIYPKVVGILTGHVHTAHSGFFAGVPVSGAPSTASMLLPFVTTKILADAAYPPGFALHTLDTFGGGMPVLRTRYYTAPMDAPQRG